MKTNAIIRIIVWSLVILILLGILISVIMGATVIRSFTGTAREQIAVQSGQSPEPEAVVDIAPSQVERISIKWAAGNIRIATGDGADIRFSESAGQIIEPGETMVYDLRNRELTISYCSESLWGVDFFGRNTYEKDLTISVPRDWFCQELEIDAAAAWVSVSDMNIGSVDFDGASGECEFERCTVSQVELDTASGDIRFSGSLDALDCDAASASIYAELANVPRSLDLDSLSGDLEITLPENAGFTLKMDALNQDFSSDFETTTKDGSYVSGDGHCRINVDALSGKVCIRKHGADTANVSADGHLHSDACLTDPNSCPDNHHEHSDLCLSDPSSCPDHQTAEHSHSELCETDPNSCPETGHNSENHSNSHSNEHGH